MGHSESWDPQDARVRRVTKVAKGTWDGKVRGVLPAPEGDLAHRVLQGALSTFNKMTLGQLSRRGWTLMEHSEQRFTAIRTGWCWSREGRSLKPYTTSATSSRALRRPWAPKRTPPGSAGTLWTVSRRWQMVPTGWIQTLAARPTPSKSPATSHMVDRRVSSPSRPPRLSLPSAGSR